MAKVIGITSSKGGVAKSTSTVEIASIYHDMGYRVLVIDLDENCSLTMNIGADITEQKTIYDVLHGRINIFDTIQKTSYFDIVSGSKSLSLIPQEFVDRDDVYLLADLMEILQDEYDFIFLDNAASRSLILTMIYIAADIIVIPTDCDDSSIQMVVETERDIMTLVNNRHHDSHAKVIGYILARYKKNTSMHAISLEKLQDLANQKENPPFVMTASETIKLSEAKTFHVAVSSEAKSSKTGREYYKIAEEMLRRMGEE